MPQFMLPAERHPFYDKILFAIFVLVLPPLLASKSRLLSDGDVSWHIAAGRWILEHGRVPDADPFSFTMPGAPWVAHEWLSEVLYAIAYNIAGFSGSAALVLIAIAALHLVVFLHLRTRVAPLAMLGAFAALDLVLPTFLLARPHVLVWPLLAAWTAMLLDSRDRGRPPPLALAVLMLLWTNLHGSFHFGLVVAAAIGLDAAIAAKWDRRLVLGWINFGLMSVLAALINANGADGLVHPFTIMGMDSLPLIKEWRPSDPKSYPFFYVSLLLTLAAIVFRGTRLKLGEGLFLLLLLGLAFMQGRHQSWLVIVAVLMLPPRIAHRRESTLPLFSSPNERSLWLSGATVAFVGSVMFRALLPFPVDAVPTSALPLIASVPADIRHQPVFNGYSFGGPVILAGARPYIDGRADMYGDAFVKEAVALEYNTPERFPQAAQRYGIGWTILRPHVPLVKWLDASPDWRRLRANDTAVIHVRRAG